VNQLDLRAVIWGCTVGIGAVLLSLGIGAFLPLVAPMLPALPLKWILGAVGLAGRFAAGLAAGAMARREGVLHGLVVGAIVSMAGFAIVWTLTIVRFGTEILTQLPTSYWTTTALWTIAGLSAAIFGGWLGAEWRRAK
jgi:hypothetical protein